MKHLIKFLDYSELEIPSAFGVIRIGRLGLILILAVVSLWIVVHAA